MHCTVMSHRTRESQTCAPVCPIVSAPVDPTASARANAAGKTCDVIATSHHIAALEETVVNCDQCEAVPERTTAGRFVRRP